MISNVCDECYPEGRINSVLNSSQNKIRSRSLMPDGTVLTGEAGRKANYNKYKAQERGEKRGR